MRPTVPGTSVAWAERREALVQMPDWQARGRIAVKSADGGGQGSIRWRQADSGSRVHLSGPFGVGAYEISWKADSVEIIGKAGEVEIAYAGQNAAERFLMDHLTRIPGVNSIKSSFALKQVAYRTALPIAEQAA